MNRKKSTALLLALLLVLAGCRGKESGEIVKPGGSYDSAGQFIAAVPDVSQELAELIKKNRDAVAWLQVPNTKINEGVVQGRDNDYYMRRDLYGNYSYEGCYYMDYESVMFDGGADLAQNTIIYGHNLGTPMGVKDDPEGVKFAQLFKLDVEETAKKTPYIYLTTESGPQVFEIFAIFYCEAVTSPVPYHHADYSEEQLKLLVQDAKARSQYLYDVDVTPQDRLLTLSTCSYQYGTYAQNPNQRYVVMARRVRQGEKFHEEANMKPNPNPKAPVF